MSTLKFDEGRLMQVLVAPIVSEKATMVAEKSNAVTFKVLQNATKPEIKAAVELMFKVEVKGVSVVNTKGKTKRFGKTVGRRDNVRKAYVTLQPGQEPVSYTHLDVYKRQIPGGGKAIRAEVPLSEMFGYSTTLRSATQGRATYSMEFKHYSEAPRNVSEAIMAARAK